VAVRDAADLGLERSVDEQGCEAMGDRPHRGRPVADRVHRGAGPEAAFDVRDEDVERFRRHCGELRILVDAAEIRAEHHAEVATVLEREVDVRLEECDRRVEVGADLRVAQRGRERGEPFVRDRLEDAAAVGEVVVRGLVAASEASLRNDSESGPCSATCSMAVRRIVSRSEEGDMTLTLPADMTTSRSNLTLSCRLATVRP